MSNLEQKIKKFLEDRGWDNLRPGDLSKSITIEAGELLEIFQWDNPSLEDVKKDEERMKKVRKELADVLIYCYQLAVSTGINAEEAILEKLQKAEEKYPVSLFKKGSSEEPGTESAYWKIKKEHRQKGE